MAAKKTTAAKAKPPAKKKIPVKKSTKNGKKLINLALQGGGAHGAFTWGVLDRILEDDRLEIEAISGTSAGAMNGVVAAYGLIEQGPEYASELLRQFWRQISSASSFSPLQPSAFDKFFGYNMDHSPNFFFTDLFTRLFSPYQYNIFDINPLQSIIEEMVNFEVIRENTQIKLFINATNVHTGKIKVFKTPELRSESVLASACLPHLFKTVYVEGEPYWDGGYSGNPALYPLFYECSTPDIVIVQINPIYVEEVPTHATEILDRVNEISFNSTLMREVRAIEFVKRLLAEGRVSDDRYTNVRLHLVEAEDMMADIGTSSKFNADWDFLQYLHSVGYQAAESWLEEHYDMIGVDSTVDLGRYL